jgi:acyl phosphate:glycerol-3-phosphate acyltransferase
MAISNIGGVGLLVVAYLLGSIPTGYIVGRMAGIDIRTCGSGSTGATNVWRNVGRWAGIFVFAIDLLKGLGAVLLMRLFWGLGLSDYLTQLFVVAAAMLALLGHTRSIWLGFKGGKAVASGLGVLLALNWVVAVAAFGVWLATMGIWQTVSISSIVAAIAAPVLMILTQSPIIYSLFTLIASGYVVWLHRSNIERLRQGNEPKLFSK